MTKDNRSTSRCQLRSSQGSVGRKTNGNSARPRTETLYKVGRADKLAQHSKILGSTRTINNGFVQLEFTFLSGETCPNEHFRRLEGTQRRDTADDHRTGVSRGHSTAEVKAGRSEPVRCSSTTEPQRPAMNPNGGAELLEDLDGKHGRAQDDLLEKILSRENVHQAWKRVKTNGGSAGIDQMSVDEFLPFARQHWKRIRSALMEGNYRPAKVRRVVIPKATGGERLLGIPTVLDRVIQQAISQVINPLFEAHFSQSSYGFRPQRKAHDAVNEMAKAWKDGMKYAADCDLKNFFDTVNRSRLMNRLAKKITDRRVLALIGRYLRVGIAHPEGREEYRSQEIPQGSPLSPLLVKKVLDELDKELEKRKLRFARYADDFLIFVHK